MELITLFRIGRRWVVTGSSNPVLKHFDNRKAAAAFARELAAMASRSVIRVLAKDGTIESQEHWRDGAFVLRDASSNATVTALEPGDPAAAAAEKTSDAGA